MIIIQYQKVQKKVTMLVILNFQKKRLLPDSKVELAILNNNFQIINNRIKINEHLQLYLNFLKSSSIKTIMKNDLNNIQWNFFKNSFLFINIINLIFIKNDMHLMIFISKFLRNVSIKAYLQLILVNFLLKSIISVIRKRFRPILNKKMKSLF